MAANPYSVGLLLVVLCMATDVNYNQIIFRANRVSNFFSLKNLIVSVYLKFVFFMYILFPPFIIISYYMAVSQTREIYLTIAKLIVTDMFIHI